MFARTGQQSEAGGYGGITCFIVEANEWELGSHNNVPGQVGWQAEPRLDGVHVSDDRVLVEADSAFYDAIGFLSLGRLVLGAHAVGLTDHLLGLATEYAADRETFGEPNGRAFGSAREL